MLDALSVAVNRLDRLGNGQMIEYAVAPQLVPKRRFRVRPVRAGKQLGVSRRRS
jgi:hypothetical protein